MNFYIFISKNKISLKIFDRFLKNFFTTDLVNNEKMRSNALVDKLSVYQVRTMLDLEWVQLNSLFSYSNYNLLNLNFKFAFEQRY